jgi:glycosyltransferase involved in cell wall biosynthesis
MVSVKCIIFGTIAKEKGYPRAIEVIEKNPNISLLIIGALWNPLEQKTLDYILEKEKKLKNLKVEVRKIEEHEFEKYARKADIILLPYLSVVPASGIFSRLLKCLKPMITWNTSFFKECEEKYGACVTVDSAEELEKKILEVAGSKKLREKLKKGAQNLLEDRSWKNVAKNYLELYKRL